MKPLLSLLMVYVLMQVQAQALSGGPVFDTGTGNAGANIGTFSGVLLPSDDNSTGLNGTNSNSLGIFSLGSPATGLATGSFAYFDSGATYVGTIIGLIDPASLELRGLVRGTFRNELDVDFNDGSSASISVPNGYANGSIDAQVGSGGSDTFTSSGLTSRITGTADLDVQNADSTTGQPVGAVRSLTLDVDGFKQAATVTGTTDVTSLVNLGSGTSN